MPSIDAGCQFCSRKMLRGTNSGENADAALDLKVWIDGSSLLWSSNLKRWSALRTKPKPCAWRSKKATEGAGKALLQSLQSNALLLFYRPTCRVRSTNSPSSHQDL